MENLGLSFDQELLYKFDEIVETHQPALPYHNKAHNQQASLDAVIDIEWCLESGLYVRDLPIVIGMRGHDLGVEEDFRQLGFETAETYAAEITANAMKELGLDEEQDIKPAKDIVIITNPALIPTTVEHKIARRADVANIGGDFVPYVAKSGNLWQETRKVSGELIGYEQWCMKSCTFLTNLVLGPDLSLGEFDQDDTDQSFFQRRARENVAKLGCIISQVAEIFESVPGLVEGSPLPDYETLLVQQGIQ